jgi:hypothetical protein
MVAPPFTPTSSSFPSVPVEQLLSMQIEVTVNTPPLNVYVMVAEFDPTVSVKVVALARGAADTTNATATKAKIASLRLVIRTEYSPFWDFRYFSNALLLAREVPFPVGNSKNVRS